jgi:sugar lactone lactonase YvrE
MINKRAAKPAVVTAVFLSIFMCVCMLDLFSVEVKKINVYRFEDFQRGEFRGAGLDSKGRLFIGPRIKAVPGPAREYYLALDIAANGDIYVGTGHNAAVYRVNPNAAPPPADAPQDGINDAVQEIFKSDGLDVYAVLVRKNGDVYAATSPDGKIYRITGNAKDRKETEFFDPGEKFIWDLKEDNKGNIICAVGNSGGIYRIDQTGQPVNIFTSEDTHIVSLAIARGGAILAGSGDRGILYRIDDRKVKVLFDSPFEEIRGICEDKNGNIYFAATRGLERPKTGGDESKSKFFKKKKNEEVKVPEKSILYCLHTDGTVETPWKSRTEYIHCAHYDEKTDSVIIGTGNAGRVYRVKKDGFYSIIYESDSAQVFRIAGKNNGFTIITNNTAAIANIEDTPNDKGAYYSEVYDLGSQSKLGRLYWEAQTTGQTGVLFFIRTGNSNVPDNTWSQWSPPFSDSGNSSINFPDCRYFQVKVLLNSMNTTETPYLESFKVYYIQSNLSPRMKKIEIKKPTRAAAARTPDAKTPARKNNGNDYLMVSWSADDPNNDKLKYNVSIKKYNAKNWILIEKDLTERKLKLNTVLFQDGKYLLRVEADDSLSNPPAMARVSVLDSSPFLIDSTAPVVTGFSVSGTRVSFTVKDQTSIVSRVLYSFDGKLWYPVFPVDMIADSSTETYDLDLKNPRSRKFIFIKVMDEFDNRSVFQEEF